MWASQNGHMEVVDKLVQHGATVDLQKVVHYNTPQMRKPYLLCTDV